MKLTTYHGLCFLLLLKFAEICKTNATLRTSTLNPCTIAMKHWRGKMVVSICKSTMAVFLETYQTVFPIIMSTTAVVGNVLNRKFNLQFNSYACYFTMT